MGNVTKIYTKTGDKGRTSLCTQQGVSKCHIRIELLGAVDELNAHLGLLAALLHDTGGFPDLTQQVQRIQNECFNLGADLASDSETTQAPYPQLYTENITQLELEIDQRTKLLAPLTSFILPGGSALAAQLHICRTVCRRAERRLVQTQENENISPINLMYLNRLSDWLFIMARFVLKQQAHTEKLWQPTPSSSEQNK